MRADLPSLADMCSCSVLSEHYSTLLFFRSREHFGGPCPRLLSRHTPKGIDRLLIDEALCYRHSRGILENHHDAKFLMHGFLPLRLACAHQFRYDQGIPDMFPLSEHFYADPE